MRRKINFKELLSNNRKEVENDYYILEKIELKLENKLLNKQNIQKNK